MRKNQHKSAKKPSFSPKRIKPSHFVLGVDEAGRGAWAGPVVAACVLWSGKNPIKNMLRDSKKMNPLNREETYAEILSLAETGKLTYGVGVISNDMIDAVGIREANRLAMEQALLQVLDKKLKLENSRLFIDGLDNYIFDI